MKKFLAIALSALLVFVPVNLKGFDAFSSIQTASAKMWINNPGGFDIYGNAFYIPSSGIRDSYVDSQISNVRTKWAQYSFITSDSNNHKRTVWYRFLIKSHDGVHWWRCGTAAPGYEGCARYSYDGKFPYVDVVDNPEDYTPTWNDTHHGIMLYNSLYEMSHDEDYCVMRRWTDSDGRQQYDRYTLFPDGSIYKIYSTKGIPGTSPLDYLESFAFDYIKNPAYKNVSIGTAATYYAP